MISYGFYDYMGISVKRHKWVIWTLSCVLAFAMMIFQRLTGPTYPVSGKMVVGTETVGFKFYRSHAGPEDHRIQVRVQSPSISGEVKWKRYKTEDPLCLTKVSHEGENPWTRIAMRLCPDTQGNVRCLEATLPHQPPAGKLLYFVDLWDKDKPASLTGDKPVIIRFRGDVPAWLLILHIVLLVVAMVWATQAALEALLQGEKVYSHALIAFWALLAGGLVLGPLVQYYAFGAFWTGFPMGYDLTDTKTLFSFFIWLLAIWRGRKSHLRWWVLGAFASLVLIYLIPHSLLGSELDYGKGP
jgi:hypothetical protein